MQSWVEGTGATAESRSRLMLAEASRSNGSGPEGGYAVREFTRGPADSGPRFSPDGQRLAFLRAAQPGAHRQVWLIQLDGGEGWPLTNAPQGVHDFAWSPDGTRIVYSADTEAGAGAAAGAQAAGPSVVEVTRIRYRHDLLGWRGDAHFHLFVAEVESGTATQITHGDWDDYGAVWSPDGTRIAFLSGRRDDRDFRALTEAYVINTEGGPAECWSGALQSVGAVAWAPDSRRLAAVGSTDPAGMVLWQGWLYLIDGRNEPQRISDDHQRPTLGGSPGAGRQPEIRWTGDGRILFLAESRGESHVYEASADGALTRKLWGGEQLMSGLSLDAGGASAAVATSSPTAPSEVHHIDLREGKSHVIAAPNAAFVARMALPTLEKFSIHRGGFDIECRLWIPADLDRSTRHPLVLDIHGGPNGAFYDAFVTWQQALAGSGYIVLAVNPRGSSTYGDEFMRSVLDDWGGEDYLDLMSAVDYACQLDYVDSDRVGIHGYSYGGYMSSWAIGHSRRFAAAVVGAPCTNLLTMYGTSDIGISFGEPQWGGSVMETPEKLLARSPISHVGAVTTPVLLLHGEADLRCPVAQSEEYFSALRRLGKTVEFVRFPGSNHQFPRTGHPKMREEYLSRMLDWFDEWMA